MNNQELADFLLPKIDKDLTYYETKYPKRPLPETAIVTRYAPSPTGHLHMGAIFACFIEQKMAHQTGGVFFLRIEDTDKKREVENGITNIIQDLNEFNLVIDEGVENETTEKGVYGPYVQSQRQEIYQTFAKYLVANDLAYPCFCSAEDLARDHEIQISSKERQGYYGKWARCRNIPIETAVQRIKNGEKFVLRLKSPGKYERKIRFKDLIKGEIEFPENDIDIVLIKSDGLPLYHLAHLVDDYLMRTTHVIRGEEWLSSVPLHLQLFQVFGFKPPKYAHIPGLSKEEDGNKRKLSKRRDPEAAISYYHQKGIPPEAVLLYLATIANSNFEDWYEKELKEKGCARLENFQLDFKKIGVSAVLFDLAKLTNIVKNYIGRLSAEEVYQKALTYAEKYNSAFAKLLSQDADYSLKVLGIERGGVKPRKDISCFSEVQASIWYMFDELFYAQPLDYQFQTIKEQEEINRLVNTYLEKYFNIDDDKNTWFEKIKQLAAEFGYAREVKEYKANPSNYKGHVGDVSMVLRVITTTQSTTPDLFELLKLLGKTKLQERFAWWQKKLSQHRVSQ